MHLALAVDAAPRFHAEGEELKIKGHGIECQVCCCLPC
jgi:hypothetical protein